jgi:hypothetical protein
VIRGNGGTPLAFSSPSASVPEDTAWYHYVVVFDAAAAVDQVTIYRDGGNPTRGRVAGALSTASNDAAPTIGKKPGTGVANPLCAALDELTVFKRVLSEADVRTLYNSGTGMRI